MRNSEKRAKIEAMKAKRQDVASGKVKLTVYSPSQLRQYGQYFPADVAAGMAMSGQRINTKPSSRLGWLTGRIGARKVTRRG